MNRGVAIIIITIAFVIAIIIAVVVFIYLTKTNDGDTNNEFACGKSYDNINPRFITNASDAHLGSAPWLVSITVKIFFPGGVIEYHDCGGSIISPEWVLTATHCIRSDNETDHCVKKCTVVAGSMKRNDTGYQYGTTHKVVQQIPFDKNYDIFNKDIALIKVSPPFEYRKPGTEGRRAIGPVCLPKQDEPIEETEGDIVGFGGTNDTWLQFLKKFTKDYKMDAFSPNDVLLQLPENMQTAHVDVVSRDECAKIPDNYLQENIRKLGNWKELILDSKAVICAGNLDEHKFGCHADSGGPLTVENNGSVTLIGITHIHLSPSCVVDPVWYTVFTRVSHFRNWIKRKSGI